MRNYEKKIENKIVMNVPDVMESNFWMEYIWHRDATINKNLNIP